MKKKFKLGRNLMIAVAFVSLLFIFLSPFKHHFYYPQVSELSVNNKVDEWVPFTTETYGLNNLELTEAKAFVKDSIVGDLIFDTDSAKARHICNYIFEKLGENVAFDDAYSHKINAWQQWQLLYGKSLAAYCVGYATIYHLFAGLAGLSVRMVAVSGKGINHIFCETYLREEKSWVLTDIMYQNVLRKDEDLKWINTTNYRNEAGKCLLLNKLCVEFENASHFKYYTHDLYNYGYPFSYGSMVERLISPSPETKVLGKGNSAIVYTMTMVVLYLAIFLVIYVVFAFFFDKTR